LCFVARFLSSRWDGRGLIRIVTSKGIGLKEIDFFPLLFRNIYKHTLNIENIEIIEILCSHTPS
jgi:hypothetical protein